MTTESAAVDLRRVDLGMGCVRCLHCAAVNDVVWVGTRLHEDPSLPVDHADRLTLLGVTYYPDCQHAHECVCTGEACAQILASLTKHEFLPPDLIGALSADPEPAED